MNYNEILKKNLDNLKTSLNSINFDLLYEAAQIITFCLEMGGKVMVCGNGGSASDSSHFAAELVGKFQDMREPLAALALTTDIATITAISNDMTYGEIFERQVKALGKKGDVLICLSTSGNSENVIEAARAARELGIDVITLTGGGALSWTGDVNLVVSGNTARIQECHKFILHSVTQLIEQRLSSGY